MQLGGIESSGMWSRSPSFGGGRRPTRRSGHTNASATVSMFPGGVCVCVERGCWEWCCTDTIPVIEEKLKPGQKTTMPDWQE